jgi:hypothetical protein
MLRKANKFGSSRHQINIKGAKDGILILPGNQYRLVLEVAPVNFELRSEDEQDAIIDTYESFLNSLPCALQILVRVRELDMDKYVADLDERLAGEREEVYRKQLGNYTKFVRGLVSDNKILSRHFYVILPHATNGTDFAVAKEQLLINSDIVDKGMMRLGVQTRRLGNAEILDLFRSFYTPEQAKRQTFTDMTLRLLHSTYVKGQK